MAQPVRFEATVEQVTRHAPDVCTYRLRSAVRLPIILPGQFIHLTIDDYDPADFWPESRVFSVANAATDRRTVLLTISRQGAYTSRILDTLRQGDRVWGKGPYGEFSIRGGTGIRRAALIAGGTGVTPFCAFMDDALNGASLSVDEVVLFYGARTPDLLIYRGLADACAARIPWFRVIYHAESASADDSPIRPGRLDPRAIVTELGDIGKTAFYISGPKQMIDYFLADLNGECGIPLERLIVDAWE